MKIPKSRLTIAMNPHRVKKVVDSISEFSETRLSQKTQSGGDMKVVNDLDKILVDLN
jgi:hypothetical protein